MLTGAIRLARHRLVVRSVPWIEVGPLIALACLPLLVTMARGGQVLGTAVAAWVVIASSTIALAFDEPARPVLSSVPVSAPRRVLARAAMIAVAVLVVGLVVAGLATWRDPVALADGSSRLAEGAAVASISAAAAAWSAGRDGPGTGLGDAAAGPGVVLTISAFAQRWHALPMVGTGHRAGAWWVLTAISTLALVAFGARSLPMTPR